MYVAGLVRLAESSGHRGETLTSIKKCSSHKRTHQFLLQTWEALMFKAFMCVSDNDDDEYSVSNIAIHK